MSPWPTTSTWGTGGYTHTGTTRAGETRQHTEGRGGAGREQAGARGDVPAVARPVLAGLPAGRGDRAHAVGDALPPGRALALRRLPEPERARLGPARLDGAGTVHREHRRRALVRIRPAPHPQAGRPAREALRHHLVLAQAVRALPPQPRADPAPARPVARPPGAARC